MKGRDRNARCWCGSELKYKKCHLARDAQKPENLWNAVSANKKAFSERTCFARDVGLGPCEGKIIRAHSVSRGPNLNRIAVDGHVLTYQVDPRLKRTNGSLINIKEVGINQASAFYGFCGLHDRVLFSCLENEIFAATPLQCLTVAYRTISRELYGKDASAHLRTTLHGADKGRSLSDQFLFQAKLSEISLGNEAARRELRATFDCLTSALVHRQVNLISSMIIEFDGQLPFMFAGAWSPLTDFYGRQLQDVCSDQLLEQIIVSSFAAESRAIVCISWREIEGAPGRIVAEQISMLPSEEQASAVLQFVVKHIENIFFNPDWYRDLEETHKKHLQYLAEDGLDFMGSPPSALIRREIGFDLPPSLSVTWQ
ncbi:SEC-C domain-containing protein [Marivivens sp. LCG002]|uniref:SEC-C domain-containing protein n=1 Tax=Marivivens sp. LCG002 TaxID=3051171 RepID=UPI002557514B|nr:SEC-C domain-containing protein [Marivivens sp. LCG002]WIV50368.1 SEC-C domain-containing protein [Marivivens sp. LCG002]